MEEDRIISNLGPDIEGEIEAEVSTPPKQPKRRFVGRRAAEQAAQSKIVNGSIEDTGAIQGVNSPISTSCHLQRLTKFPSFTTSPACQSVEQYPPRNPTR
jgi:2-(3-amino-3-carboxypropyl)histidine synthase